MSITNITKRIACFYDNKGEEVGKKSFSKTADTLEFAGGSYNVIHEDATFTTIKRWYWNLEVYHYNINNPDPIKFDKIRQPILNPELYNIQLKTSVARQLNDLSKKGFQFDFKVILIIVAVIIGAYLLFSGQLIKH